MNNKIFSGLIIVCTVFCSVFVSNISTFAISKPLLLPFGVIESITPSLITGYACNPEDPSLRADIRITIDGKLYFSNSKETFLKHRVSRPEITFKIQKCPIDNSFGAGRSDIGFEFVIPDIYRDNMPHQLKVAIIGKYVERPCSLTIPAAGSCSVNSDEVDITGNYGQFVINKSNQTIQVQKPDQQTTSQTSQPKKPNSSSKKLAIFGSVLVAGIVAVVLYNNNKKNNPKSNIISPFSPQKPKSKIVDSNLYSTNNVN